MRYQDLPPKAAVLAALLLLAACSSSGTAGPSADPSLPPGVVRVLFDDSLAETAGNADWVVSTAMPDPAREDASPSRESDWTGALSAWGVALQRTGSYRVMTLPPSGRITFGDTGNPKDLSRYDVYVLPEPNLLLSPSERAAVLAFVHQGGGLFLIADHAGSDRNRDGADSVEVLDALMGSDDPFGFTVDARNIRSDDPDVIGSPDAVLDGPFGRVRSTTMHGGTTATLRSDAAKGDVYLGGAHAGGSRDVAFATARYGAGRVAFWGDSSPVDDGTGHPGDELFDDWSDASNATLALNATAWLAG